MTAVPELSGVDLARQALLAAREAAKKNGAQTKKPKRRTGTVLRRDGREPLGLGAAISMMMTERGLVAPAAGGSVLAQWPGIAAAVSPTLPAHVQATGYDPETGRLDLRPDSPAYATQLRLLTARIIATANEHVGAQAVRALRVLPPGAVDTTPPPAADSPAPGAAAAPAGPVKTRETASAGYRLALDAHHTAVDPTHQRPATPDDGDPSRIPADARSAFDNYRAQARETASAVQDATIRRARAECVVRRAGMRAR
ncbi:DciA family protein [Streptomyces sp. NPDC000961]|uniref:DciA family protein n=1 Tax=Streptomyces sp. NPDC000961 TaxID=3364541 RepID=UPI00369C3796